MKGLNKKTILIAVSLVVLIVLGLCLLPQLTRPDQNDPSTQETTDQPEDTTVNPTDAQTTPAPETTATPETTVVPETTVPAETTQVVSNDPEAYKGKIVSILGDSISTFSGYIPVSDGFNLKHNSRYPDGDVRKVEQTWWMKVITALDAKLGINDSWRGTTVIQTISDSNGVQGDKTSMVSLTRIQNLGGNGTPDIILFYGGTNDYIQGYSLGAFNPKVAPTEPDLTAVKFSTVAEAYVETILRLKYFYPNAQIVAILPAPCSSYSNDRVKAGNNILSKICEHYEIPYIDQRDTGITTKEMFDGLHPNIAGMDIIADAVLDKIYESCPVVPGETTYLSITHRLTSVTGSLSYYKKIAPGSAFSETLSGEDMSVTVTMGGKDITAECYADGVINIPSVTADLTITAKGKQLAPYAAYISQLPETFCAGTNLWNKLTQSTMYYTGSDWAGLNKLKSVTFPVKEGDKIWANSFQAASVNGGSSNGIRITFFTDSGVLKSIAPANVYSEFKANGYITVPKGATAVNVPVWNSTLPCELYILSQDHTYTNGTCSICGAAEPQAN